jgi:hypothetical protein
MPPRTLTNEELGESIRSLHEKLRAARRTRVVAYVAGATFSLLLVTLGLILLWYGPYAFLDRVLGLRRVNTITSMALWWGSVVSVAVFGGAMGIQTLSGKLRYARHWKHRVDELTIRLHEAEREQQRRNDGGSTPTR